jgi:HlyD family secretion protein
MSTPAGARTGARSRRRSYLTLAALVALAALALLMWRLRPAAPPRYTTVAIARGTVSRAIAATGTVNPVMTVMVGSYVSGVIQAQYCDFNTRVRRGQLCAKIDPRPYQTVVDENAAALATARAQLAKDGAALDYAELNLARQTTLLARGVAAQDAVDAARSAQRQARAQRELDLAVVRQREAALAAARVNLGYTDIVSPVDGTVVTRNVTLGQTVAASFQTPTLFLIATDLTRMQVDTNVSESDIGEVTTGDAASFDVEAYPGRSFGGRVLQVRQAPQAVQNVVTYDVVVGVDNPALALKPGMTATVAIVVAERRDVLRVPDQALRYAPAGAPEAVAGDGRGRVWVLRDGTPQALALRTGLDDDSYTEVVGGALRAGDRVIVGEQREAPRGASPAPLRFGL